MENSQALRTVNSRISNIINTIGVPQRVLVSFFGFLAIINASSLRLCLDTTLEKILNLNADLNFGNKSFPNSVEQVGDTFCYQNGNGSDTATAIWTEVKSTLWQTIENARNCSHTASTTATPTEAIGLQLNWSKRMQTIVIISFYAGYVLSQIPGGILAQKYGGKRVLAVSLSAAGILTILTPITIKNGGPGPLILLRILLGLCEGPAFPALSALLSHWIPPNERGKLGSFALSGGQVGVVLVNIISTLVFHLANWPVIFYFFGVCALIWALGFILICSDEPTCDPYITTDESIYLQTSLSNSQFNAALTPIPWRAILINVPVWAMISSAIQYNWAQAEGMTILPPSTELNSHDLSLNEELRAKLRESMPHMVNWFISVLTGSVCDRLVDLEMLTTTDVRKIMAAITALGPRLLNDLNACLTCNEHEDLLSRTNCAIGVVGTFYAGAKLTPLDLSPNYAGILMAISNGVGSLSAVLIPQLEENFPSASLYRSLRSTLCLISALSTSGDVQNFDSAPFLQQREN